MRYDEGTQTSGLLQRKLEEAQTMREGIELFKKQKRDALLKKYEEQREVRKMLENYWPWSVSNERPRGFNNMDGQGIYPHEDFQKVRTVFFNCLMCNCKDVYVFSKAKRWVGPLGLGRPGGGAPMVTHTGTKLIRTREDPQLRFQWSNDLRRTVDNTLRYKTNRKEQEEYRKQLGWYLIPKKK